MKSIKLLLFAVSVCVLSSCSKDDPVTVEKEMMIGEWNLESFRYEGSPGTPGAPAFIGVGKNIDATVILREDNTFNSAGDYDVELTVMGTPQIYPIEDFSSDGTWYLDGNSLVTSDVLASMGDALPMSQASEQRATVSELSANKMILKFDDNISVTQAGVDVSFHIKLEYILTR